MEIKGLTVVRTVSNGPFYDIWQGKKTGSEDMFAVVVIPLHKFNSIEKGDITNKIREIENKVFLQTFQVKSVAIDQKCLIITTTYDKSAINLSSFINSRKKGLKYDYILSEQVLLWCQNIADALESIHTAKYFYYCLSSQSISISSNTTRLFPPFLSFPAINEKYSKISSPITTLYSSPEVLRCEQKYTKYNDYWSFGVILYELCYGKLPFNNYFDIINYTLGKYIPKEFDNVNDKEEKIYNEQVETIFKLLLSVDMKKREKGILAIRKYDSISPSEVRELLMSSYNNDTISSKIISDNAKSNIPAIPTAPSLFGPPSSLDELLPVAFERPTKTSIEVINSQLLSNTTPVGTGVYYLAFTYQLLEFIDKVYMISFDGKMIGGLDISIIPQILDFHGNAIQMDDLEDITHYAGQCGKILFHIRKLTEISEPINKSVKISFKWYNQYVESDYGIQHDNEIIFDFKYEISFILSATMLKYLETEKIDFNLVTCDS